MLISKQKYFLIFNFQIKERFFFGVNFQAQAKFVHFMFGFKHK